MDNKTTMVTRKGCLQYGDYNIEGNNENFLLTLSLDMVQRDVLLHGQEESHLRLKYAFNKSTNQLHNTQNGHWEMGCSWCCENFLVETGMETIKTK